MLGESVKALSKLTEEDGTIKLFDFHSSQEGSGNFQLAAVQRSANGALAMALGAFYFHSVDERRRFLFFKWGSQKIHFWTATQRMTLERRLLRSPPVGGDRDARRGRVEVHFGLKLGSR